MNRRVEELQRTLDDLLTVEVVIVGLAGLVEHTLDANGVEVGRTMPVTKPADIRLHQSYGNLVAVDDLTSHETDERVKRSPVVAHTLDLVLMRLHPLLVVVHEVNEGRPYDVLTGNPADKLVSVHIVELQVLLLDTLAVDAEYILTLLHLLIVLDLERRGQFIPSHEHRSRDVLHHPLVRDPDDDVPRLVLPHVVLEHLILNCCHKRSFLSGFDR